MEPAHIRFGGGSAETILHPLVAVVMLITIGLIMSRPREKVITPFLLACLNIPIGQVVVLGSVHFTVLRILIIAGLIRRATTGGSSSAGKFPGGFNSVDRMVVLWTISGLVILSLQWMDMQALIHNLGDFLDALGGYMVVRYFIPDIAGVRRAIKALAVVCVIQGAFMMNEQISHVNLFGYLGGISLGVTVRDGNIRSGGVMGGNYAGAFAGVLFPLFFWLYKEPKSRNIACLGIAGALAMTFTPNSSTSLMAMGGSFLGLAFWSLRKRMRLLRIGLVAALVSLHMVMKAPVWALIARIDLTGSSSGWHRYALVDATIRHFNDWWLLGYRYYNLWGWDMWDLCNQFVAVAMTGGLLTLVCYITIFSRSLGAVGTARKQVEGDRAREWFIWCLGSGLFATLVAHFGINYMAQQFIGFFPLLACISVAAADAKQAAARTVAEPAEVQFAFAGGAPGNDLPLHEAR